MKQLAINACLLATAVSAYTQGAINFNNRVISEGGVVAPIYGQNPANPFVSRHGNATTNGGTVDYTGHPLLAGTGFTAQLFAAAPGTPVGQFALYTQAAAPNGLSFRTGAAAGFLANLASAVSLPASLVPTDGTPVSFQVRAWDNLGGTVTTWAAVLANPAAMRGSSDVFTFPVSLSPPGTPNNLVGMTSFNIGVPEPGVIALGVLGVGALLLRRRK